MGAIAIAALQSSSYERSSKLFLGLTFPGLRAVASKMLAMAAHHPGVRLEGRGSSSLLTAIAASKSVELGGISGISKEFLATRAFGI
jgi:hypothetical protein